MRDDFDFEIVNFAYIPRSFRMEYNISTNSFLQEYLLI